MRYFLELSYNGKAYHGWQKQPNAITVQEVIENGLSTVLGIHISIVGAGRTDTGVHAAQMFAHFDMDTHIDETEFIYKINAFLPLDIAIKRIIKVGSDAHARFDAKSRLYIYNVAVEKNVFTFNESYYVKQFLDIDAMNEAAKVLFEYSNFQCFSKSNTDVKTYNCDIMKAEWQEKEGLLQFTIQADRFLRNMVRAIVGTLINIGSGKIDINELHRIIKSKSRSKAGYSVPAQGLYLKEINYPKTIFNE